MTGTFLPTLLCPCYHFSVWSLLWAWCPRTCHQFRYLRSNKCRQAMGRKRFYLTDSSRFNFLKVYWASFCSSVSEPSSASNISSVMEDETEELVLLENDSPVNVRKSVLFLHSHLLLIGSHHFPRFLGLYFSLVNLSTPKCLALLCE